MAGLPALQSPEPSERSGGFAYLRINLRPFAGRDINDAPRRLNFVFVFA
jgi:hypothetical protein